MRAARPLLVPPSEDGVEETLDALDGILFSGGADLDPELTAPRRTRRRAAFAPSVTARELALLEGALARDMPVLAVCRGVQVLNVARGGDLVQHLPEVVGYESHREVQRHLLGASGEDRRRRAARLAAR